MKTLQQEFDEVMDASFDGTVPLRQYVDLKRFFMAGAVVMLGTMSEAANDNEDEAAAILQRYSDELDAFAAQIREGRA